MNIAVIVLDEADNQEAEIALTGGVDGGRGWKGDVKIMQLDTGKIKRMGWRPTYNSSMAVRLTARSILKEIYG